MTTVDRGRLKTLMARETDRFAAAHPRSQALFERARGSLLAGVPMNWMVKWAGPFPLFVEEPRGARFRDVDGHEYVDFCLGDTGASGSSSARRSSRTRRSPTCSRTRSPSCGPPA